MRLSAFRVMNFRSVTDTGWIDADDVTAFIGTNESGKTNVLMPLWKLNPATSGEIDPVADYPRKRYHQIRAEEDKPTFIEARFELPLDLRQEVAALLRVPAEEASQVMVSRDFSGSYGVEFPEIDSAPGASKTAVLAELREARQEIAGLKAVDDEAELRSSLDQALQSAETRIEGSDEIVELSTLTKVAKELTDAKAPETSETSVVAARFAQVVKAMHLHATAEADQETAEDLILKRMPRFVYYSNYGNLDSEIYLPHVIDNLKRSDLGQKEQAKARTLKVLFDFVRLSPEEIQDMGQDVVIPSAPKLTQDQEQKIAAVAAKKKERDILLQSASTELTSRFRQWWKQGDYKFRFAADGNHFRIWVSDDRRQEDIELEARSTGLQWFFSFYLVFLVESEGSHEGAILLLDEPGLSLHPLAQSDLSAFFDGLSQTNQLLYTTHSPFLVDPDHLDRARAVYTDPQGVTQVSPDLRAPADKSEQAKAVYAAYAAVGMSVSETMLLGCQAVVVEGPSDQHYLSAIKNYLVGKGLLRPTREIVFMPSGGVKGVKAICGLVMGRDEDLPFVLVDSDEPGARFSAALKTSLYAGDEGKVLGVGEYVDTTTAEIEDLFPPAMIAKVVDRYLAKPADVEQDFADSLEGGKPIVPQIERYAQLHRIELPKGWKVDIAKRVKTALLRSKEDVLAGAPEYLDAWKKLFGAVHPS